MIQKEDIGSKGDEQFDYENFMFSKMQIPQYTIKPKQPQFNNQIYDNQIDQINMENIKNNNLEIVSKFEDIIKQFYSTQSEIPPLFENMEGMKSYDIKDYYINLKTYIQENDNDEAAFGEVNGDKVDIEVDEIFEQIMNFKPASKILILGGAGVGKSTLMQFMAYKWSTGKIWIDKFSMVYRVMLKTLLNQSWKVKYQLDKLYSNEIDKNPLKFLIHYNIVSNSKEVSGSSMIKPEDIKLDKKDSILLLLDGYDEIHHLYDDPTCKSVLAETFQQKYVILTSRPNAVSKAFRSKFERTIENTGLDKQGIQQYIDHYFQGESDFVDNHKELKEIIEKNASIGSICHIPVNLAIICYIFSSNKESFSQIFNSCQLYKIVVEKLGQRFISKEFKGSAQEGQSLKDKIAQTNRMPELKVISYLAYIGLTGGGVQTDETNRKETLIVKTYPDRREKHVANIEDSIEQSNTQTSITKVISFGLLKQEGVRNENTSYSFIHLSFQEYLTADFMTDKLAYGSDKEQKDIIRYISTHRNDPRLLLTLKFMSGIISQLDNQKVTQDFWNSMCCNVDGIIEFSLETKVKLLMNLLGQSIKEQDNESQFDKNIPNLCEMQDLIDITVINDVQYFKQQLRQSNYFSKNIEKLIISLLQGNDKSLEILENIKEQYINRTQQFKDTLKVKNVTLKNSRILDLINYIIVKRANVKIQQSHNNIQMDKQSYNQIPIESQESINYIIINGLNISLLIPQKINQNTLQSSIQKMMNSNTNLQLKKKTISLINQQLDNINVKIQQKLFENIISIEINYLDQYKQIATNNKSSNLLIQLIDYYSGVFKQNKSYDLQKYCCLFCKLKSLNQDELIFQREEYGIYEQFILSFKYMFQLDIDKVLQWIQIILEFCIHIEFNIFQQIASLIQIIQNSFQKKVRGDNLNIQKYQLFMKNIQEIILCHYRNMLSENIHCLFKVFSNDEKQHLTNLIYEKEIEIIVQGETLEEGNKRLRDFHQYKYNLQKYLNQNNLKNLIQKTLENVMNTELTENWFLINFLQNINEFNRERLVQIIINYFLSSQKLNKLTAIQVINSINSTFNKNYLKKQQCEEISLFIYSKIEQEKKDYQQDAITTIVEFFGYYNELMSRDEFNISQILKLIGYLKNNKFEKVIKQEKDFIALLNQNQEFDFVVNDICNDDNKNSNNIIVINLIFQSIFSLKDNQLKYQIIQYVSQILMINKNFIDDSENQIDINKYFRYVKLNEFDFQFIEFFVQNLSLKQTKLDFYYQFSELINNSYSFQIDIDMFKRIFCVLFFRYINHQKQIFFFKFIPLYQKSRDVTTKSVLPSLINHLLNICIQQLKIILQSFVSEENTFRVVVNVVKIINQFTVRKQIYFEMEQNKFLNVIQLLKNITDIQLINCNQLIKFSFKIFRKIQNDQLKQQYFSKTFNIINESIEQQFDNITLDNWLIYSNIMSYSQNVEKIINQISIIINYQKDDVFTNIITRFEKINIFFKKIQNQEIIKQLQVILQNKMDNNNLQNILQSFKKIIYQNDSCEFLIKFGFTLYNFFLKINCQKQIKQIIQVVSELLDDENRFDQILSKLNKQQKIELLYLVNNEFKLKLFNFYKQSQENQEFILNDFKQFILFNLKELNQLDEENQISDFLNQLIKSLNNSIQESNNLKIKFGLVQFVNSICDTYPNINLNVQENIVKFIEFTFTQPKQDIDEIMTNKKFTEILQKISKEKREIQQIVDEYQFEDKQIFKVLEKRDLQGIKQLFKIQNRGKKKLIFLRKCLNILDKKQEKQLSYYANQNEFRQVVLVCQIVIMKNIINPAEFFNVLLNEGDHQKNNDICSYIKSQLKQLKLRFQITNLIKNFNQQNLSEQDLIEKFNILNSQFSFMERHQELKNNNIEERFNILMENQKKYLRNQEFLINHKFIIILLAIISFENEEYSDRRDLIKECKQVLKLLLDELDEDGIKWIIQNIQFLSSISYSSNLVIQKIFQVILKDGYLSDGTESQNAINEYKVLIDIINLSANIQINENGILIFDGQKFKINLDKSARISLDKELSKLMRNHKNPIINQYIDYQPLFINYSEMFQSRVDKEELSIIDSIWNYKSDKKNMIISSEWKLIELMGYTGEKILFFEKRDIFGNRMICKINQESNNINNKIVKIFDDNVVKVFGKYSGPKLFYGRIFSNPLQCLQQFNIVGQKQVYLDWNEIKNDLDFANYYIKFTEIRTLIEQQNKFQQIKTLQAASQQNQIQQDQNITYNDFQQVPFELYHDALLRMDVTSWRMQDVVFFEFTKTLRDYEQTLLNEIKKLYPGNQELQQQFLDYYRGFVKTFSICFTEAQVIVSGKFDYDKGCSGLNAATKLISFIPLVGEVSSSVFQSVGEFIIDMNIQKNAKALLNFAYDHTDLSQKCGLLALLIIQKQQNQLFEAGYIDTFKQQNKQKNDNNLQNNKNEYVTQNPSIMQRTKDKIQSILKQITSLTEYVDKKLFGELYRGEHQELGNNDATQLIGIICKCMQNNEDGSENEFEQIKKDLKYEYKNDLKQIKTKDITAAQKQKATCKCEIF